MPSAKQGHSLAYRLPGRNGGLHIIAGGPDNFGLIAAATNKVRTVVPGALITSLQFGTVCDDASTVCHLSMIVRDPMIARDPRRRENMDSLENQCNSGRLFDTDDKDHSDLLAEAATREHDETVFTHGVKLSLTSSDRPEIIYNVSRCITDIRGCSIAMMTGSTLRVAHSRPATFFLNSPLIECPSEEHATRLKESLETLGRDQRYVVKCEVFEIVHNLVMDSARG